EMITPQSGSTYGSPNNHSFAVNNLTAPLGGGIAGMMVRLKIYAGAFTTNTGAPVAPNDNAGTDVYTPSSTLFSDSFTGNPGQNSMTTFDQSNSGINMPLGNPSLITFQWDTGAGTAGAGNNSFIWYRGTNVDPGGQIRVSSAPDEPPYPGVMGSGT